jgi:putative transposase
VFGGSPGSDASLSWTDSPGFHLQQNAQAYVPRKDMQAEVAEDIRTIFNAPDHTTADAYLAKAVAKYQKTTSRLAEWMAVNIL